MKPGKPGFFWLPSAVADSAVLAAATMVVTFQTALQSEGHDVKVQTPQG
jgi:hypothetical protein